MTKFSYDRHGNIMEIKELDKNASQEDKNFMDALANHRGIYYSKEAAEVAYQQSQPTFYQTGIGHDGEPAGYWK